MQFVLDEYKDRLQIYYNEACAATSKTGSKKPALSMDAWCDICKGELRIGSDKKQSAKAKALWKKVKVTYYKGGSEEAKEFALVGDYQVHRESQITGDDRCKEVFKCRLTLLEVKFAFLNSQGMEQMKAGDATDDDAMACLDFDEFLECICRCGRDKFVECGMPLHEAIRGFILNLLGLKMEEGVMRDYFYISADRYDWRESKPMEGQKLTAHRKWLDCWQNLALSDLHYFPTWEKEVRDRTRLGHARAAQHTGSPTAPTPHSPLYRCTTCCRRRSPTSPRSSPSTRNRSAARPPPRTQSR